MPIWFGGDLSKGHGICSVLAVTASRQNRANTVMGVG